MEFDLHVDATKVSKGLRLWPGRLQIVGSPEQDMLMEYGSRGFERRAAAADGPQLLRFIDKSAGEITVHGGDDVRGAEYAQNTSGNRTVRYGLNDFTHVQTTVESDIAVVKQWITDSASEHLRADEHDLFDGILDWNSLLGNKLADIERQSEPIVKLYGHHSEPLSPKSDGGRKTRHEVTILAPYENGDKFKATVLTEQLKRMRRGTYDLALAPKCVQFTYVSMGLLLVYYLLTPEGIDEMQQRNSTPESASMLRPYRGSRNETPIQP